MRVEDVKDQAYNKSYKDHNPNWINDSFYFANRSADHNPEKGVGLHALFARTVGSGHLKYVDSAPGGNFCINPLPQACLLTDPPPLKTSKDLEINPFTNPRLMERLGSVYSEMYDDPAQIIYMRFGVPVFNSLIGFYSRIYVSSYSRYVRTAGITSGLASTLGSMAGHLIMAVPTIATKFVAGTVGIIFDGVEAINNLINGKTSSLYYFKSTQFMFWGVVQNIFSTILVNQGLHENGADVEGLYNTDIEHDRLMKSANLPIMMERGAPGASTVSELMRHDNLAATGLARAYPDLFTERGYINVFALASRAQRMQNAYRGMLKKSGRTEEQLLQDMYYHNWKDGEGIRKGLSFDDPNFLKKRWIAGMGTVQDYNGQVDAEESILLEESKKYFDQPSSGNQADGFLDYLKASIQEGTEFVGLRVNNNTSASESFSNSFIESAIKESLNSTSGTVRQFMFSTNRGQIGAPGGFGAVADFATSAVSSVLQDAAGILDNIGLGGATTMMGMAFADVPKFWGNSSAQLTTMNYTCDYFSWSGDALSRALRLHFPLAVNLASALPRSAGRHSYTEPFLCQLFDKGRAQTRLGMVKSLSITRGDKGNIAWNLNKEPLTIRVSFDVQQMNEIIHMPVEADYGSGLVETLGHIIKSSAVNSDMSLNFLAGLDTRGIMDMESLYHDYMAILGSLDFTAQIYPTDIIKRRFRINQFLYNAKYSKAANAMIIADNDLVNWTRMFVDKIAIR